MRTDDRPVEVSVVIAARDAAETVGEQLAALAAQDWCSAWEVVVVDNRSRDRTADVVRTFAERHARIRLVHADEGDGPSHARNVGARSALGRSIVFCDADDVVSTGWLAAMAEALRRHEFVTGPLDFDRLNPAWIASARGREWARARPTFEGIFPYASSCNMGVRASLLAQVGGFDAGLLVGEDLDLSLRLWVRGVDLHFEPGALVHYRYRPTLASMFRQARSFGRVRPVIGERLRDAGRAGPGRLSGLRNWLWLARRLPLLRSPAGRAKWLWVAGNRIGNLEGSIRTRRVYL